MDRDAARLARWRDLPYAYPEVGATAAELPTGYHHVKIRADLGRGPARFEQAADLLLSWQMHRRAGLQIIASHAGAVAGAVVVQGIGVDRFRLDAGCRVISMERSDRRAGFTYGTLRGHPIAGEEAFGVVRLGDDRVVATITAFDRPGRWFVRLGGPLRAAAQAAVLRRYLAVLRAP